MLLIKGLKEKERERKCVCCCCCRKGNASFEIKKIEREKNSRRESNSEFQ